MKIEHITADRIELHLSDNPDQFSNIAEIVRVILAGRWTEQIDGLDQSYWDLKVQGTLVTVHREHYLGVSVFCADGMPQRLLLEHLQREFTPK
jgi:hypothetical protein